MQLKHTHKIVQSMEKVLWPIERVRSGSRSFVLEISRRTVLHGRVDQLSDSNQIETLTENNQCYTMRLERAYLLKISKSITLLVKMKNVSFILRKKPCRLWGQPTISVYGEHREFTVMPPILVQHHGVYWIFSLPYVKLHMLGDTYPTHSRHSSRLSQALTAWAGCRRLPASGCSPRWHPP